MRGRGERGVGREIVRVEGLERESDGKRGERSGESGGRGV